MKIAIDARSLEGNRTGVGRYLENILKVWKNRKDVEFALYFKDAIPEKKFLKSDNFTLKQLKNPLGFSSNFFFQHFLLPYNIKKDEVDFFFSPFYLRPLFCPAKSAIVLHDISYEAHPEWFDGRSQFILRTLSRISTRKADVIFTVSEYSKKEIMKYYGIDEKKVTVTPLAPDSDFYKEENPDRTNTVKNKYGLSKFVLNVGTVFTRRHVPEIIEAFGKFLEGYGEYQLCIVGRNNTFPFVDIDARIREINYRFGGKKIIRLDSAPEDELMVLYSSCEAVIYLSDYEGFGLPVVESQFFEKPVITSCNTSLIEVGGGSVEFTENNASSVLDSLNKVLEDKEYCDKLVMKGKENVRRFDWRRCADMTLEKILSSTKQ